MLSQHNHGSVHPGGGGAEDRHHPGVTLRLPGEHGGLLPIPGALPAPGGRPGAEEGPHGGNT